MCEDNFGRYLFSFSEKKADHWPKVTPLYATPPAPSALARPETQEAPQPVADVAELVKRLREIASDKKNIVKMMSGGDVTAVHVALLADVASILERSSGQHSEG